MARKPRLFAPGILYHVIRAWAVSRQRTVIGYVLVRRGGYGVKEVAEYFGRDLTTMSSLISRYEQKCQDDRQLKREIDRLSQFV
jgi:transposase